MIFWKDFVLDDVVGPLLVMPWASQGEDNVQRLAALVRRLPVAPLPGGGRALVQPIHQDDVTRCLLAALDHPWTGPDTLVAAGPEPLPYREFLAAVARAAGLVPPRILSVPVAPLMALASLTRLLPFLPWRPFLRLDSWSDCAKPSYARCAAFSSSPSPPAWA